MKYHLVESHLGGYYISKREPEDIEEFCETCGDNDWILFSFEEEKKQEAFLEYFQNRMMTEEDIKREFESIENTEEIVEDIEWSALEDQNMLQVLLEDQMLKKEDYQKLLKAIRKNKKSQVRLFQKVNQEMSDSPKKMVYQYYPKNFTT